MIVFAFDTAMGACSVACIEDGVERGLHFEPMPRGHAEVLMDRIARVERQSGVSVTEADRLAVTIGPGTFTGVRVGLAAAKAMALATGKPLIGVSTLQALAAQAPEGYEAIAVAVDARRGQIYSQIFDGKLVSLRDAGAISAETAASDLAEVLARGRRTLLMGSAAVMVREALDTLPDHLTIDDTATQPSAREVALIASRVPANEIPHRVAPLYLRPPDAKPQAPSRFAKELGKHGGAD